MAVCPLRKADGVRAPVASLDLDFEPRIFSFRNLQVSRNALASAGPACLEPRSWENFSSPELPELTICLPAENRFLAPNTKSQLVCGSESGAGTSLRRTSSVKPQE